MINRNGKGQETLDPSKKNHSWWKYVFIEKMESYLPNLWPAYYKFAKGCMVKDLDGNKYIDMTMGVGTNILGYSNRKVNNAVINAIKRVRWLL